MARGAFDGSPNFKEVERAHRDGGHSFLLQEKGATHIEIDFQRYEVKAPAVLYMHPNQVHRLIGFNQATIVSWIITNENILPDYLQVLEELTPVDPLPLQADAQSILSQTASLCIQLAEKKHEKLYHQILTKKSRISDGVSRSKMRDHKMGI